MDSLERIQVASADTVLEFQNQLNYLYTRGYRLLSQSTAPLGDKIIFTAVLERAPVDVNGDPTFEATLHIVEHNHEVEHDYEEFDDFDEQR